MSSFKDGTFGVSEGALFQIPPQTFWSPRVICCQNVLSFWRKRFIQGLKNVTLTPWRKDSGRVTAFPRLMLLFCWISCVLLLYFIPLAPADFDSYTEKCQHILERCLFSSDVRPILVHPNCRQLSHLSTFPKTFARANKAFSLCDKTLTFAQKWPQKELLAHAALLYQCAECARVCVLHSNSQPKESFC